MKNTALGLCVFVIVAFTVHASAKAPQNPSTGDAEFLLGPGKAGFCEIGSTVDEIYGIAGRNNVRLVPLFIEGMFEPALEIQLPGAVTSPSIIARIREWPCAEFSIWAIEVRDRRFRTPEGIGIGSTFGELRQHYKAEKVRMLNGGISAVVPSMNNMSFVLDTVDAPGDTSKVKSIFITSDPETVRKRRCPQLGPL